MKLRLIQIDESILSTEKFHISDSFKEKNQHF